MLLKRSTIVLVLLVLLVGLTATSASAAKADSVKKPTDDGLVFTPVSTSTSSFSASGEFSAMATVYTIRQGQTNWHPKYIPPGYPGYYLDLNWGNSANSLQLRVYGADGRVYGPFYDGSDGRIDGRILFWVSSGSGTLPSGTYYHEVYGYRVSGIEDYTF